jgi:hypothetical protein
MLTKKFCVRENIWEKEPHTHSPPPLSVVGVSNNWYQRKPSLQALKILKDIHRHTNG